MPDVFDYNSRVTAIRRSYVMDGWTIGLWAVGAFVAVAALAKIMTARRNQALGEWQAKVAAERRNKKKT